MIVMKILKFIFTPALGTIIFLAVVALMALIQFLAFDYQELLAATAYMIGYLLLALSLKLIMSAVLGVFVKNLAESIPRKTILLTAIALLTCGIFLLAPLLSDYAR